MVDTEVIDHHIDREHPHDDLIDDYGNIFQVELCIVEDNKQQHKQESGGDDHDEVAFKQVIQFSPEQLADDKSKYHRNNYRKIQISVAMRIRWSRQYTEPGLF